ncbi:MAG: Adenylosuccinate synthetase [Thermotoga sp. 47_83]|uniref:Adenylosuccinate synthetase n=1 Tax=Thermotoga petrophila TaxID=93929 RepID=A0A124FG72_9THEM|nr:MAG: Adenylosuccinate synthetase [Thermotoga petrophila]KUK34059.1 MAG: Adenylosuccinate synthetase [Thermotoga sp. 47_83]HAA82967.1 adenylosuccinate synthase [Thermotoga petrophila]HBT99888.1 adenylosuccinate synthase [Thermotoga petrophila]
MNRVVVGLQWGDEGKGKVVTYLSRYHDIVARFSGGANAGHTVNYGNFKVIHHLLPSADFTKNRGIAIGSGVLLDPQVLTEELRELKEKFPDYSGEIFISESAHVVLPVHKEMDRIIDEVLKIGTTKRGIGPACADRVMRVNVRVAELGNEEKLRYFLEKNLSLKKIYGVDFDAEKMMGDLSTFYETIKDFVVSPVQLRRILEEKSVLFEGTQGVLLDLDVGTYPYVTSMNCSSSGVSAGMGFPVEVDEVLGVFKAYTTRVGEGPFPTELTGEEGEKLRKAGHEYGSTTGRPRRCGWLDLPLLRYAIEISGVDSLVMTKADVLNGFEKIKVCVRYSDGRDLVSLRDLEKKEPVYEVFDGWKSLEDKNFERFVDFIERETGRPVRYISTGEKLEDIVEV